LESPELFIFGDSLFITEMLQSNLHFHKTGHGPNILLAFHGIGQDGLSCFRPFTKTLGNYYTIYAFDLYFHGKYSQTLNAEVFVNDEFITKDNWKEFIQEFLFKENISRFDVAGFSIGGRFALATLESFSSQINKAFLIAPDGISEHPLYTLASRFLPARYFFRWLMQNPNLLFMAANVLQKYGLIHSSLYRFTQNLLNTPEKRQTIYNSWVAFRELHFDIQLLYQKILTSRIDLYLFVGKYDKLLKVSAVQKLSDLLPGDKFIILQSGHSQLVEKTADHLQKLRSGDL
jgi:pimeloyl-ACP methyl ester carboxylesterase